MLRMLLVSMVMLLLAVPPLAAKETPKSLKGVSVVSVDKVKEWLDDGEEIFILDARKREQYEEAHLPEAVRCPVNTELGLGDSVIKKAVKFLEKCEGLSDFPKNGIIVTYCNAHT